MIHCLYLPDSPIDLISDSTAELSDLEQRLDLVVYRSIRDLVSATSDTEIVALVVCQQIDSGLNALLRASGISHFVVFCPTLDVSLLESDSHAEPVGAAGRLYIRSAAQIDDVLPALQKAEADLNQMLHQRPLRISVLAGAEDPDCQILSGSLGHESEVVRLLPDGKSIRVSNSSETSNDASIIKVSSDEHRLVQGDLLCAKDAPCEMSDQFSIELLWLSDEPCFIGRAYRLDVGGREVVATISDIKHKLDPVTNEALPTRDLRHSEVGQVSLSLSEEIVFDDASGAKSLSHFQLQDRYSGEFLGLAVIQFALRRAANVHKQSLDINKAERAKVKGHKGRVIWFTGLSGSGKSTVANALEQALHEQGRHTYILDGDNVRHGLNKDLGFTDADRVENIRRISEVAKLMVDAGLIVLTAFISPFRSERDSAREMFETGEFMEVYVDVPLDVAEQRDPKGLYKKARSGDLPNFTGIDSAYEPPIAPEIHIDTSKLELAESVARVLEVLDSGEH